MALFNYATKEITLKIVYYGPGLSGKTTNLQYLHSILNPETKGRLLSLSTEADRTLFFDFLPVELGKIREFSIRFQLYTVPGQVRYNATRKIVLKGADAVVYVADSQQDMREQNIESFQNMRENLLSNNLNPDEIPVILQYNKRDLKNIASVEELDADLNPYNYPTLEACAINGVGVEDSFKLITKLLLKYIAKKHQIEVRPAKEEEESSEKPAAIAETVGEVSMAAPDFAPAVGSAIPAPDLAPAVGSAIAAPDLAPAVGSAIASPETVIEHEARSETATTYEAKEVSAVSPEPSYERIPENVAAMSPATEQFAAAEAAEDRSSIHDRIDLLGVEISALHGILTDLKNSVYVLSKEMKDLKDIKKEQEEAGRALKELSVRFAGLKTKRSWFRF